MNDSRSEPIADRIGRDFTGAMSLYVLLLGHRLGLLRLLAERGLLTAAELAGATGYDERYLAEWLAAMAAGGYIACDAEAGRFWLTPEQAAVYVDVENPAYAIPVLIWAPRLAGALPALAEAFRTGGGVPYEAYEPAGGDGTGNSNRVEFLTHMAAWLRAVPDVWQRVAGARAVLDVGCGHGWSSIALAHALPEATIDGADADPASLAAAERNVMDAGLAGRIRFHLAAAEDLALPQRYDLITALECVHDMAQPVAALRRLRELLAPDGVLLIVDERMGDTLGENLTPLGHLNYVWSVLHCLPQARVDPDAAGTGCAMGPARLRDYATAAGFGRCDVLPIEHPAWRFYRLSANR